MYCDMVIFILLAMYLSQRLTLDVQWEVIQQRQH